MPSSLTVARDVCERLHPAYTGECHPDIRTFIIDACRRMIMDVVTQGIVPVRTAPVRGDGGLSRTVSFPKPVQDVIHAYADTHDISPAQANADYLAAAVARGMLLAHRAQRDGDDPLLPYREALAAGLTRRDEQNILYGCLEALSRDGAIGFVEGATGIGKTLAMIVAAMQAVRGGGRAVIATPTLQVLRDFITTHARLYGAMPDLPPARVVLGMAEYVAVDTLLHILPERPAAEADAVRAWLEAGGAPLGPDADINRRYLASSLAQVAPDLPVDGVRLGSDSSPTDPGRAAYAAQFGRILPMSAYVCVRRLRQLLDDGLAGDRAEAIREWLRLGAPAADDSDAERDHLVADLRRIADGFSIDAVRLQPSDDEGDPGYLAWSEQSTLFLGEERGSAIREIILCTHAMLTVDLRAAMRNASSSIDGKEVIEEADSRLVELNKSRRQALKDGQRELALEASQSMRDVMRQRDATLAALSVNDDLGRLPAWQHLIIDEAHQFESNAAGVLSTNLSMIRMRGDMARMVDAGFLARGRMETFADRMRDLGVLADLTRDGSLDVNDLSDATVCRARVALLEAATAVCQSRQRRGEPRLMRSIRQRAQSIKEALRIGTSESGARANLCRLHYTPVRDFPTLVFGRHSIARELAFLWERAQSVAFVSATLYLRRGDSYSPGYMASLLNAVTPRTRYYDPILPAWSLSPVVGLWTPANVLRRDGSCWLQPPSRADRMDDDVLAVAKARWIREVAAMLTRIHRGDPETGLEAAVGGTLVLMTSYESVAALSGRLLEAGDSGIESLIVANPGEALTSQRRRFMALSAAGKRPVWLALGGAWTGLDINGGMLGIPAAEDSILTDLVIPRIPFGLNKSLTHLHRLENQRDVPWEMLDTVMRMRQGLGRAIRREGLPSNRRIFVLDGRLNDRRFDRYLTNLRKLLGLYPAKTSWR